MKLGQMIQTVVIAASILIGAFMIARAIDNSTRYEYAWFPGNGDRIPGQIRIERQTGRIEFYLPSQQSWIPW